MHKPDEIQPDIWEAAQQATGGWMAAGEEQSNSALVRSVARALQAERTRGYRVAKSRSIPGHSVVQPIIASIALGIEGGEVA